MEDKNKIKVGDIVRTIQGPKKVTSMNKEVVRFDGGFAPIDRVISIKK